MKLTLRLIQLSECGGLVAILIKWKSERHV